MSDTKNLIDSLVEDNVKTEAVNINLLVVKYLGVLALYITALFLFFGVREDISTQLGNVEFIAEIIFCALSIASGAYISIILGVPDIDRKRYLNFLPIIPVLFIGLSILADGNISAQALRKSIEGGHIEVTAMVIAFSIIPAVTLFYLLRKLNPIYLSITGFMIILSATSFAHMFIRLSFASDNLSVVLLWCFLPIILISFSGIFFGKKFLRW